MRTAASRGTWLNLPAARIYLDDLEVIVGEIAAHSGGIEITFGDYVYDNFEEFKADFKVPIRTLMINGTSPSASLLFSPKSLQLSCLDSDLSSLGLVKKIQDRLLACAAKPRFLYRADYLFWTMFAFGFAAPFIGIGLASSSIYSIGGLVILPALILWGAFAVTSDRFRYCILYPKARHESPGFFARNTDNIALSVISTVIGIVLGGIGTLLITKWPTWFGS